MADYYLDYIDVEALSGKEEAEILNARKRFDFAYQKATASMDEATRKSVNLLLAMKDDIRALEWQWCFQKGCQA